MCSVGLEHSTPLCQSEVLWRRWTTLIDTIRWSPSFTEMFVIIFGFQWRVERRWYRHHPDRLEETDVITMMWDTTIPTVRKIKANRPDICLRNRKTSTCLLIDISTLADGKIGKKHAEKLAKYSDLLVQISRKWHCQTLVVLVVLGALDTVHASFARWLDIIPGHPNLQQLQETLLLGSTRILSKVMSCC